MRRKIVSIFLVVVMLVTVFAVAVPGNVIAEESEEGVVAYWKFDEGSGQIAFDNVENNNDGILGSSPGIDGNDPIWVDEISGKALEFDRSNDYVQVPNSPELMLTKDFTYSFWAKKNNDNNFQTVIDKGHLFFIDWRRDNGGWMEFWFYVGGLGPGFIHCSHAEYLIDDFSWRFFTYTYDGFYFKSYVDGNLYETQNIVGELVIDSSDLTIGYCIGIGSDPMGNSKHGYPFGGKIDEVKIWNRVLTEVEIKNQYKPPDIENWGYYRINAHKTYDDNIRGKDITIAIIDSGINYLVPSEFGEDSDGDNVADGIWINTDEFEGDKNLDGRPGIMNVDDDGDGLIDEDSQGLEPGDKGYTNDLKDDDDENGYVDDIWGWDFENNDMYPDPDNIPGYDPPTKNPHGSGVASIISSRNILPNGRMGIAPDSKIMNLKVLSGFFDINLEKLANAIYYAVDNGANVISLSMAGGYHRVVKKALDYAYSSGCIIISASGNSNDNRIEFPASSEWVLSVGATNKDIDNKRANSIDWQKYNIPGSNYGKKLDLVAPGTDIWVLNASSNYYENAGTSFATAFVTGVAALILEKNKELIGNPKAVYNILRYTATDITYPRNGEVAHEGWDIYTGWGLVDAWKAAYYKDYLDENPALQISQSIIDIQDLIDTGGLSSHAEKPLSQAISQLEKALELIKDLKEDKAIKWIKEAINNLEKAQKYGADTQEIINDLIKLI